MVITKRALDLLLLFILAIFPFGQLPGIFLESILRTPFRIHILDLLVGAYVFLYWLSFKNLARLKGLLPVVLVFGFSIIISIFSGTFTLVGAIYFIRLVFYLAFIYLIDIKIKLVTLVVVGGAVATFGWIQYFVFPDLTALKLFGWDDHYFRLAATFLDPAFTGAILLLATFVAFYLFGKTKSMVYLASSIFLAVSLGFTYSRASYIAFLVGLVFLLFRKAKRKLIIVTVIFALVIVFLPRGVGGEGVKLTRTSSISFKLENYAQSFRIISYSPLFGVGYNNVCKAKEVLFINTKEQKNSCNGLDNSFLFILATSGVPGIIVFIYTFSHFRDGEELFTASLAAVFIHSLFTNTLFYPWVLVWLAFLKANTQKKL